MTHSHVSFSGIVDRRHCLRVGAIGTVGLTLPQLLHAEQQARGRRELSCILVFAWGGPHHIDTFDPKPDAPAEIRSHYGVTATTVPGLRLIDQFPRLAQQAQHFSLIRSISHASGDHNAAAYAALTGRTPPPAAATTALLPANAADFPSLGSILAKLKPTGGQIPPYVMAPVGNYNLGVRTPGHRAGFLGETYNPFSVAYDAPGQRFTVPALALPRDVGAARMDSRRELLTGLDRQFQQLEHSLTARNLSGHYERAFSLISSPETRRAFEIRDESQATKERYGQHTLGRSLLLARRLIETGVRIVMVSDADERGDVFRWDTHNLPQVLPALRRNLPETDVALSGLLVDLRERGMLDSTLVVWMGEMGRTPRERTGHWTRCYPALFAGAGIQGGRVYGQSDRIGAMPREGRCSPGDIHATIYRAMGIPGDTVITDAVGREIPLYHGEPIRQLF